MVTLSFQWWTVTDITPLKKCQWPSRTFHWKLAREVLPSNRCCGSGCCGAGHPSQTPLVCAGSRPPWTASPTRHWNYNTPVNYAAIWTITELRGNKLKQVATKKLEWVISGKSQYREGQGLPMWHTHKGTHKGFVPCCNTSIIRTPRCMQW